MVAHFLVRDIEGRPVESGVHVRKGRHAHGPFPLGARRRRHVLLEGRKVVVPGSGIRLVVVEDLPGATRPIPVVAEIPGKSHYLGQYLTPPLIVRVHARGVGVFAGQERSSRRVARRRGGEGAGKEHALFGQTREAGCPRLGMSAERLDPVVQVVNGDEQDVRRTGRAFVLGSVSGAGNRESKQERSQA